MGSEALPQAAAGQIDLARESMERNFAGNDPDGGVTISVLAALGDRQGANEVAAEIDARPGGPMQLISAVYSCACGAPFDLSATPNFRARIEQAGINWPPSTPINYPAKDW